MSQFGLPNPNDVLEYDSSERFYKYHSVGVIAVPSTVTLLHAYAVIRLTPRPRSMFTRLLCELLPVAPAMCICHIRHRDPVVVLFGPASLLRQLGLDIERIILSFPTNARTTWRTCPCSHSCMACATVCLTVMPSFFQT